MPRLNAQLALIDPPDPLGAMDWTRDAIYQRLRFMDGQPRPTLSDALQQRATEWLLGSSRGDGSSPDTTAFPELDFLNDPLSQ